MADPVQPIQYAAFVLAQTAALLLAIVAILALGAVVGAATGWDMNPPGLVR